MASFGLVHQLTQNRNPAPARGQVPSSSPSPRLRPSPWAPPSLRLGPAQLCARLKPVSDPNACQLLQS